GDTHGVLMRRADQCLQVFEQVGLEDLVLGDTVLGDLRGGAVGRPFVGFLDHRLSCAAGTALSLRARTGKTPKTASLARPQAMAAIWDGISSQVRPLSSRP